MKRIVLLVAVLVFSSAVSAVPADEIAVLLATPDGQPAARLTISHPEVRITAEFLDALEAAGTILEGGRAVPVRLAPDAEAALPSRLEVANARSGYQEKGTGEWVVDWSGTTITVEPLEVAACDVQSFTLQGSVRRDEVVNFQMSGFAATAATLNVVNRDADLLAYDTFGFLGSSELGPLEHRQGIPDALVTKTADCLPGHFIYEVRGVARRQSRFHLSVVGFDVE